jgi:hypothetical protein
VELSADHFECFLNSKEYSQHYLKTLLTRTKAEQHGNMNAYLEYVSDRFAME